MQVQVKLIDVQEFINERKLSRLQMALLGLCFLVVAIDGFDIPITEVVGAVSNPTEARRPEVLRYRLRLVPYRGGSTGSCAMQRS